MEREKISQMQFAKASKREIAKALGRSLGTIIQELQRNSIDGQYTAVQAQNQAQKRKPNRPFQAKMASPKINSCVRKGLTTYWPPEQLASLPETRRHTMTLDNCKKFRNTID